MTDGVTVDTSGFRKLAKDLRAAEKDIKSDLRKGLKAAGEVVAADARALSSWSSRIPRTIKVSATTSSARVKIIAGRGEKFPHIGEAVAYENGGRPGPFRHRVFGHDVWTDKNSVAKPFLHPALERNRDRALKMVGDELDKAWRRAGFH